MRVAPASSQNGYCSQNLVAVSYHVITTPSLWKWPKSITQQPSQCCLIRGTPPRNMRAFQSPRMLLTTYIPTPRCTEVNPLIQMQSSPKCSHLAGQPDDFVVLHDLCVGAASRLVKGGSLYIVAQAQVPVGAILRMARPKYACTEANITADNRFVIWRAVAQ